MHPTDCFHREPARLTEAPGRVLSRSSAQRRTARALAVVPVLAAMLVAGTAPGCLAPAGEERADGPTTALQNNVAARSTGPKQPTVDVAEPTSTQGSAQGESNAADATPYTGDAPSETGASPETAEASQAKDAREALLERLQGTHAGGTNRSTHARNPNAGIAGTALDGRAFAESHTGGPEERPRAGAGEKPEDAEIVEITGPEAEKLKKAAEAFAREFASRLHAGDEAELAKHLVT